VVACLEVLEHVPDPGALVATCASLVRPGGDVFFATINRNPKSYLFAIVGAEHLLKLLPKGTHDYARFIRPAELAAWSRAAGLVTAELAGMHLNPLTGQFRIGGDVDVNYLVHARRPA
jgi:2-polyprenyl-6-hydroxyphenyl methylase/3-demethylubiquinone-9 3-methyltransferase